MLLSSFGTAIMFLQTVVVSGGPNDPILEYDESSVTGDFDLRECRRAAKNLDESLICNFKFSLFTRKFYRDGTPRASDPDRATRIVEDFLESEREVFRCENAGMEVLAVEALVVQQNTFTGQYVITTRNGEMRHTPREGDLCTSQEISD